MLRHEYTSWLLYFFVATLSSVVHHANNSLGVYYPHFAFQESYMFQSLLFHRPYLPHSSRSYAFVSTPNRVCHYVDMELGWDAPPNTTVNICGVARNQSTRVHHKERCPCRDCRLCADRYRDLMLASSVLGRPRSSLLVLCLVLRCFLCRLSKRRGRSIDWFWPAALKRESILFRTHGILSTKNTIPVQYDNLLTAD